MPQSQRSLQLTEAYRRRLLAIGNRVEARARELWPRIEEFDSTPWVERMAREVTRAQTEGVRLTTGYLTAFLRSEGARGTAPAISSKQFVGLSRDGRPIAEALESPLIGVRAALKQ